jgi:glycine cleavage system H protein
MSRIPADLRYSNQHAWARQEPDGTVAVGITAFLRQRIGEIVFVQQPPVGDVLKAGDPAGTVETVNSIADVFAPVGGQVSKVNQDVDGDPDSVNGAPYSAWLFKLLPGDPADYAKLLDARAYQALLDSE